MKLGLLAALAVVSGHALRMPQLVQRWHAQRPVRCAEPVLQAADQLEETIQKTTASNEVVIYSKSWCPYCENVKALFDDMSQPYLAIELDQREDGEQLQATLLEMTKQRTVPNVFVGGQHVGGNDDTQQAARSGKLAALLKAPPAEGFTAPPTAEAFTGRVVPSGGGSSATAAQLAAVESGKMITETEATIRKVAGVGIGLATAFLYSTSGLAYTTLSAGIFGALSVYRSGAAYQWGCIAGSRWNIDGVLSFSEIPAEFAEFVKAKQQQLAFNMLSSSAAGVLGANLAAVVAGDASIELLLQTSQAQVPLLILTLIASVLSGKVENKPW